MTQLKCIKGFTDSDNLNVVCLQGDEVVVLMVEEGDVLLEGTRGGCKAFEFSVTPQELAENFCCLFEN